MAAIVNEDMLSGILEVDDIHSLSGLVEIMDSVSAAFENFTGRYLGVAADFSIDVYTKNSTKFLDLDKLPINTITAFTVDEVNQTVKTNYRIADYGLDMVGDLKGTDVHLEFNAGFDADNIPADLLRAGTLQVAYEFQSKDHIGAETVSNEGGTVTRPALKLLNEVTRILDKYIHVNSLI